jgi:hypothetical protein
MLITQRLNVNYCNFITTTNKVLDFLHNFDQSHDNPMHGLNQFLTNVIKPMLVQHVLHFQKLKQMFQLLEIYQGPTKF